MQRNLDGLNVLRYVLGFSNFLDQAEEEEETVIEPEADDTCHHGIGFDEDCEDCENEGDLIQESSAHLNWLEICDYTDHVNGGR